MQVPNELYQHWPLSYHQAPNLGLAGLSKSQFETSA